MIDATVNTNASLYSRTWLERARNSPVGLIASMRYCEGEPYWGQRYYDVIIGTTVLWTLGYWLTNVVH